MPKKTVSKLTVGDYLMLGSEGTLTGPITAIIATRGKLGLAEIKFRGQPLIEVLASEELISVP